MIILFSGGAGGAADADEDGVRLAAEPADVLAPWGGRVALACRARPPTSSHAPQISWRHRKDAPPAPTDLLPAHDPRRSLLANGSLVIERATSATAGWYQCVVSADGVGAVVSRPALVLLAEAPTPVPGPRTVLGVAGSSLVLPCAVSSHPRLALKIVTAAASERRVYGATRHNFQPPTLPLNVTWMRGDGTAVRGETARVTISASGALELEPAAARDAGRYRCNVSLAAPYLTADTPAHVRFRLGEEIEVAVGTDSGLDSPPRFILTPQPTTVIEGSSVTLECGAVGNPRPEMVWLNNGVAIDLNDLDSRFYPVGAGSLRVQGARALDAGSYTCRAHNRLDSADHSTQLTVLSPPRVSIVGGSVVRARVRGDVTLRCEARGRPAPTVTWLEDGEPLTPNDHDIVLVDGDDLRIQGVLEVDAGMFQCAASSIAGDSVAALRLIVLPPNDGTLLNGSDSRQQFVVSKSKSKSKLHKGSKVRNVTLSESILNSLVSYSGVNTDFPPEYGDGNGADGLGLTATAYTALPPVSALAPTSVLDYDNDLDYVHADTGLDMDSIEKKLSENTSVSAPRSLRVVLTSQRFVTLSWEEPLQGADKITAYLVLYRAEGSQ
ncbi:Netrin receptor DCC, partial [Eumeta japonica]